MKRVCERTFSNIVGSVVYIVLPKNILAAMEVINKRGSDRDVFELEYISAQCTLFEMLGAYCKWPVFKIEKPEDTMNVAMQLYRLMCDISGRTWHTVGSSMVPIHQQQSQHRLSTVPLNVASATFLQFTTPFMPVNIPHHIVTPMYNQPQPPYSSFELLPTPSAPALPNTYTSSTHGVSRTKASSQS